MKINSYQKRTWAEISVDNLQHNFNVVRKAANSAKICCVIKANAYGHGVEQIASLYQELGADYLAVSNVEEAIQLRECGIHLPVLILGYSNPKCAGILSANNFTQCVFSREYAELLSENAVNNNVSVKVHIKIDTGMGRLGFNGMECAEDPSKLQDIESVYSLPGLIPEGIFTHFASADDGSDGREYTKKQFGLFCNVLDYLKSKGIDVGIRHCANSAAVFDYPEMHLDMVRAGVVLYGFLPSEKIICDCELRPVLRLVTIVDYIKEVKKGESISYGREFTADKTMKIATLPIGYADGLWRSNFKNGAVVEINGKYAPIVGRICMDQCMVDVSNIPDVKIGSGVTVYGASDAISVNTIAKNNGTINYEILCAIGERVPRVYIKNGAIVGIQDNIVKDINKYQ